MRFFSAVVVTAVSAGDEHSAVLSVPRNKAVFEVDAARISTFGRGAHGRLGTGLNRNSNTPSLVHMLLPSLAGCTIRSVSCGGAHTVALLSKVVPKCLANPYGHQTFVVAWGYGANGQLGV